mmetsp:Transcript_13380/g.19133  ORF Transcript_13380/g.19133 Transcript_13380/m.19133 type:complete len:439 (-) Transcript_13380:1232-2548(-)
MNHKKGEATRGFLVYVSRTYRAMVPYLKGLHLSLDSWRPGRDEDGWKQTNGYVKKFDSYSDVLVAPEEVKLVPWFKGDMRVLLNLCDSQEPPKVRVRPTCTLVSYLVGDASGTGFGSSPWVEDVGLLEILQGRWVETVVDNRSSNFRELHNFVVSMKFYLREGKIKQGSELFIFTDNSVAESSFYNGCSKSSKLLHNLVKRLRLLELHQGLLPQVIWIAGNRMIQQGTDGVSRGDLNAGVLNGNNFLSLVPINKDAIERHSPLKDWILDILPENTKSGTMSNILETSSTGWTWLYPKHWDTYSLVQDKTHFIWITPPVIADVCLEMLTDLFHIKPCSTHLFVCPALMTPRWRKQLQKAADILINLVPLALHWPWRMFEPLTIVFIFPLLDRQSSKACISSFVAQCESELPKVLREDPRVARCSMLKLWNHIRRFTSTL